MARKNRETRAERKEDRKEILASYDSLETPEQAALRQEWDEKYKRDFDRALKRYRNKNERHEKREARKAGLQTSEENPKIRSIQHEQLHELGVDIESFGAPLKGSETLDRFRKANLSIEDLLVDEAGTEIPDETIQALYIVVPEADSRNTIIEMLGNPQFRNSARGILQGIYDKLSQFADRYERYSQNVDDLSQDIQNMKRKEGWEFAVEQLQKHPILLGGTLLASAVGLIWGGKWLWTNEKTKDYAKPIGKGLLALGTVNQLARFFPGGASIWERITRKYLPKVFNSEVSDPVTIEFMQQMEAITGDERSGENLRDLMNIKGSTLASLFSIAGSQAGSSKEIKLKQLEAEGADTRNISPEALYGDIRALAILLAKRNGMGSGNESRQVNSGLQLLRDKYRNKKLRNIIFSLSEGGPRIQTQEGDMHRYDQNYDGAVSEVDRNREVSDEQIFGRNGTKLDVRVIPGTDEVKINAVPFTRTENTEAKTVTYTNGTESFTLPLSGAGKEAEAKRVKEFIKNKVEKGFADQFHPGAGVHLEYLEPVAEEGGRWKVRGLSMGEIPGLTTASEPFDLAIIPDADGNLTLIVEGQTEAYNSLDKALEGARHHFVEEKVREKLAYLFGPVAVHIPDDLGKIKTFKSSGASKADLTRVEFTYGDGASGTVDFKNGQVEKLEVPIDASKSKDLLAHLENFGLSEGDRFVSETGSSGMAGLRAAFTEHLRTGGHLKSVGILAAKASEWWNTDGKEGLFVDEEALWDEEVSQTEEKLAQMIGERIVTKLTEGGKITFKPNEVEREVKKIFADANSDLAGVKRFEDEIRAMNLESGDAYVDAIIEKRRALKEKLYRNEPYRQFKRDMETRLESKGLDYKGGDRYAEKRKLFRALDLAVDRLSWPIGIQTALSAQDQAYLNYLKEELPRQASIKLLDAEGNINYAVFVDRRIEDIPLEALGVKSRKEFDPASYRGVPTELPEAAGGSPGVPSAGPKETVDQTRLRVSQAAVAEIHGIFGPLRDKGGRDENFGTYLGTIEEALGTNLTDRLLGIRNPKLFDTIVEVHKGRAIRIVTALSAVSDWKDPTVLDRVNERITNAYLEDLNKQEAAQRMLQWWKYFDTTAEIRNSFMIRFLDKFEGVPSTASKAHAEAYALYYRWNAAKVLPNQPKWYEINPFDGEERGLTQADWDQALPKLQNIMSYGEWSKRVDFLVAKQSQGTNLSAAEALTLDELTRKPDVVDTNLELQAAVREQAERDRVCEEFEEWFDDHIDVSKLLRLDGSWPENFKAHAMARVARDILPACQTSEQLALALTEYSRFLYVEKSFYEAMIEAEVEDDQGNKKGILPLLTGLGAWGGAITFPALVGAKWGWAAGPWGMAAGAGIGAIAGGLAHWGASASGRELPMVTIEGKPELRFELEKVINKHFKTYYLDQFKSGKTDPEGYSKALKGDLIDFIQKAVEVDTDNIDLGVFGLGIKGSGIDAFQVSP